MKRRDQASELDRIVRGPHLSGWSIGEVEARGEAGSTWAVWGTNGENVIRAEGSTQGEGWRLALDQARSLGMLDGSRSGRVDGPGG